jgi:hypothetical protein
LDGLVIERDEVLRQLSASTAQIQQELRALKNNEPVSVASSMTSLGKLDALLKK